MMNRCVVVHKDKNRSRITRIANKELFMDLEIIRHVPSALSMSFRNERPI